jgi:hypothetical protein
MNGKTARLPAIQQALGAQWQRLHPAVRRHYDICADGIARLQLSGTMYEVDHASCIKPLMWIGWLFGALVPYRGRNLPVAVINTARPGRSTLFWERLFYFPGKEPIRFVSRMENGKDHEIIEYVRANLGIRMALSERDGALCYTSLGYRWDLGPLKLHLPDWLLLGKATILERGLDERTIELSFDIHHPVFGRTFTYSGSFVLEE